MIVDHGVEVLREYSPGELGDRGRAHYFYHQAGDPLPIRDVMATQVDVNRWEPCIERQAIGYAKSCLPHNVQGFADSNEEQYMLFFTRRRHDSQPGDGDQFFVGYLDKRRVLEVEGRIAVQGKMHFVDFDEAIPLSVINSPNLRNTKCLDKQTTLDLVEKLESSTNILNKCQKRVERLESLVERNRHWNEGHQFCQNLGFTFY